MTVFEYDDVTGATIAALLREPRQADLWTDDRTAALRADIKRFYISKQSWYCCYCKERTMTSNLGQWTLDHVLSRVKYPQHVFEPLNLAVACPDCNRAKHDKDVLVKGRRATSYPRTSSSFRIVHPHYDSWEDHLGRIGLIFFAKTEKGEDTISVCRLSRFTVKYVDWSAESDDKGLEKELQAVLDAEDPLGEVRAVLSKVLP